MGEKLFTIDRNLLTCSLASASIIYSTLHILNLNLIHICIIWTKLHNATLSLLAIFCIFHPFSVRQFWLLFFAFWWSSRAAIHFLTKLTIDYYHKALILYWISTIIHINNCIYRSIKQHAISLSYWFSHLNCLLPPFWFRTFIIFECNKSFITFPNLDTCPLLLLVIISVFERHEIQNAL